MCDENKFPEPSYSKPLVTKQDRDDWFNRCLADRPKGSYIDHGKFKDYIPPTDVEYSRWIDKWFSPFMGEP